MLVETVRSLVPGIEWELDPDTKERTGRWRRRQMYGLLRDTRVPSLRTACEWRVGVPR